MSNRERRQDVLPNREQRSAAAPTQDGEVQQIARLSGVPYATAQAFRAGLVVSREDSARCQEAVERLAFERRLDAGYHQPARSDAKAAPAPARSDSEADFLSRLDAGYRRAL